MIAVPACFQRKPAARSGVARLWMGEPVSPLPGGGIRARKLDGNGAGRRHKVGRGSSQASAARWIAAGDSVVSLLPLFNFSLSYPSA